MSASKYSGKGYSDLYPEASSAIPSMQGILYGYKNLHFKSGITKSPKQKQSDRPETVRIERDALLMFGLSISLCSSDLTHFSGLPMVGLGSLAMQSSIERHLSRKTKSSECCPRPFWGTPVSIAVSIAPAFTDDTISESKDISKAIRPPSRGRLRCQLTQDIISTFSN
jgi:hypothetical protein